MSNAQEAVPFSGLGNFPMGIGTPAGSSRLERLESDDLVVVLGAFGVDDLDPIVKLLTTKEFVTKEKPLKDSETFKRHAPGHHHYLAEIVEEIRWYGSHDIKDAKEPRSYRDVVADLCQRAKLEIAEGMTAFDLECLLLRNRLGAEKAGNTSSGTVVKNVARAAAGFGAMRLLGAVTGPAGLGLNAAWAVWDMFGPNYKMTARCVLTVADARLRLWCAAVADSAEG